MVSIFSADWRNEINRELSAVDAALATKQDALGYTPVNKAGDVMTGALGLTSGNGAWDIYQSNTISLAGLTTYSFQSGSGLIVATDLTTGSTAAFLTGGGAVVKIGETGAAWTAGASSLLHVAFNGTVYYIGNGNPGTRVVSVLALRTRNFV